MTRRHRVRRGECLREIGFRFGLDWREIRDHSDNKNLMSHRHEAVLFVGDELTIPDVEAKEVTCATDQVHRFVVTLEHKRPLEVRLLEPGGDDMSGLEYELEVGSEILTGTTDSEGFVREEVPLKARRATLRIEDLVFELRLGSLNPMDVAQDEGASGAQQRLSNLGFDVGRDDGRAGPRTLDAVFDFDEDADELPEELPTGVFKKLEDQHGS